MHSTNQNNQEPSINNIEINQTLELRNNLATHAQNINPKHVDSCKKTHVFRPNFSSAFRTNGLLHVEMPCNMC